MLMDNSKHNSRDLKFVNLTKTDYNQNMDAISGEFKRSLLRLNQQLLNTIGNNNFRKMFEIILPIFKCRIGELFLLEKNKILDYHLFSLDENINKTDVIKTGETIDTALLMDKKVYTLKEYQIFPAPDKLVLNNSIIFAFSSKSGRYAVMVLGDSEKQFSKLVEQVSVYIYNHLSPFFQFIYRNVQNEKDRNRTESKLRKSEIKYRSIIENSLDLIYQADTEGIITEINPAGVKMLGAKSKEDLVGKNIRKFYFDGDWNVVFKDKMKKDGYVQDFEVIIKTLAGESIFCIESNRCTFDKTGKVSSYTGILKNISERVEADKALYIANIQLVQTNELLKQSQQQVLQNEKLASIGQLSAGVAHELNNPLSFVQTNFNTMKKYLCFLDETITILENGNVHSTSETGINKTKLENIREDLKALYSETDEGISRMVEITNSLNAFSRVDETEKRVHTDLNKSIKSTLVIARNKYKYCAKVENEPGKIPGIICNDGEIKQVLLNIIVNAAQALEDSGKSADEGIIKIRTFHDQGYVNITIDDNGPGIPEEYRKKILDPFFTTKDVGKGTGLGLSISHDIIVAKHHGKLEIGKSELGGARFKVMLPVNYGNEEELTS